MSNLVAFFDWVKRGLSADDGSMDDARIHAGILVLSYIGMGAYAVIHTPPASLNDFGEFLKNFAIGAAALAGGVGLWFGVRGKN